jgi:hypothetical protein
MRRSNQDAGAEPVIGVSMDNDRIVIRLVGHVDRAGLDALRSLLDGAGAAGAVAVVDVAQIDHGDLAAVNAIAADHTVTSLSAS